MTDPDFEKGGGRFHEIFKIRNYIVNLTSNFRQKESGVSRVLKKEGAHLGQVFRITDLTFTSNSRQRDRGRVPPPPSKSGTWNDSK